MKLPLLTLLAVTSASVACDRNQNGNDSAMNRDQAADNEANHVDTKLQAAQKEESPKENDHEDRAEDKREATELVRKASDTIEKMKKDEQLKKLLSESKGVFVVPDYGRGAVGVGGRGGEGILLARNEGQGWSDPAFYDLGGVSVGAQFGGEGGSIAMLLMSDQAVESFKSDSNFSLNAEADLTIVDYSTLEQASLGKDVGNVVFWSDAQGAFAGVSLSVTDINWDDDENFAYYGETARAKDAPTRHGSAPNGKLQEALKGI